MRSTSVKLETVNDTRGAEIGEDVATWLEELLCEFFLPRFAVCFFFRFLDRFRPLVRFAIEPSLARRMASLAFLAVRALCVFCLPPAFGGFLRYAAFRTPPRPRLLRG